MGRKAATPDRRRHLSGNLRAPGCLRDGGDSAKRCFAVPVVFLGVLLSLNDQLVVSVEAAHMVNTP